MTRCSKTRRAAGAIACLALLLLAGCREEPTQTDLSNSRAILYGRVSDTAGAPIAGARVSMSYHPSGCSVAARSRDMTTTGADGRYRALFSVVTGTFGCVGLKAEANGFIPDSVSRLHVNFRPLSPFDSVATNFTLRR